MDKTLYLGLGIGGAVLLFIAYRYTQVPTQMYSTTSLNANSSPNFTTDPYQTYPFTPNVPARVDNSNQPWANNNRPAIATASAPKVTANVTQASLAASVLGSGSSIIDSGQSIWNNVSDWFSDDDADFAMDDEDYSDWSDFDFGDEEEYA